jgi:hypothetical protein
MARSAEERQAIEADENERATETGFFHFAVSYNAAADRLGEENPLRVTHPEEPREFLYVHAIELYLKAYLRDRGKTVQDLYKLGHSLKALSDEYELTGGTLTQKDKWVIEMLSLNKTNRSARYIQTGYCSKATVPDIQETASNLRVSVGEALKGNRRIVRWYSSSS